MIQVNTNVGVKGFFKFEAVNLKTGRKRVLADWFPNLVTDVGLNRIGSGAYFSACHVGTDNTAPLVSDTILGGFVAGSSTIQASNYGAQSTAPYYGWATVTYRFAEGAATGNLSEVGTASARTNGGATVLFSRALILDELGDPTTVTVLSDEVLDVSYEIRLYPDLVDKTGTITITGSGDHTYVARPASVTSGSSWGYVLNRTASFTLFETAISVYNGAIGAYTSSPSGTGYHNAPVGNSAYVANSLEKQGYVSFGLNAGNLVGGIKSAYYRTSLGAFQVEFTPNIPKDATKTLVITFKINWTRNP
jgi:hypothetical protein